MSYFSKKKRRMRTAGVLLGLAGVSLGSPGCSATQEFGEFVSHEAHVYSLRAGDQTITYCFLTSDNKYHPIEIGGERYLTKKPLIDRIVRQLPYEFVRHTERIYFDNEEEFDDSTVGHAHAFFNSGTNCILLPGTAKTIVHEFAHQWFDDLPESAKEEFLLIDDGLYGTLLQEPSDSWSLPNKWLPTVSNLPSGEKGPGPDGFVSAYARSKYTENIAETIEELLCFSRHSAICTKKHKSAFTTIHENMGSYNSRELERLDRRVQFFLRYAGGHVYHIAEPYHHAFKSP